jgi:peptide/nickel transport system substrate-binding protein
MRVRARPGSNLTYLALQEQHPPLDRIEVRQAISLAIDRSLLCRTLFDGHAVPAGGLIPLASWAHTERPALAYDLARARSLVRDAAASARPLTLLSSTDRLRLDVARMVAQELGDAGVPVQVVSLELGTLIARMNDGDFDLALLQIPEISEPNVLRHFLHSRFVPPMGANRGRVVDPVLDHALDEGDAELDVVQRRAAYAEVEAREAERMHLVPLWYEDQVAITSARAAAFVPSAEGRWLGLADIP